jgi:hypothetical protein
LSQFSVPGLARTAPARYIPERGEVGQMKIRKTGVSEWVVSACDVALTALAVVELVVGHTTTPLAAARGVVSLARQIAVKFGRSRRR